MPTDSKKQIVLLMVKFESFIIMKQKIQVEFGIQTLEVNCIRNTFQLFCEISAVPNWQHSERFSKMKEKKQWSTRCLWKRAPIKYSGYYNSFLHFTNSHTLNYDWPSTNEAMRGIICLKTSRKRLSRSSWSCITLIALLENINNQENLLFTDETTFI